MKLSELLYEGTLDLWRDAAEKPFVKEMALGTLDEERFCNYMVQDYLYLLDYIELLQNIAKQTEASDLGDFLQSVIRETENETYRVHLPQMKKLGIRDEAIANARKLPVIAEYTGFMKRQARENGGLPGLTCLLQCSWLYAYIGEQFLSRHPKEIAVSPYRFWFDAYTCKAYTDSNRLWINVLDEKAADLPSDTVALLKKIFRTCAAYENELWDELYL